MQQTHLKDWNAEMKMERNRASHRRAFCPVACGWRIMWREQLLVDERAACWPDNRAAVGTINRQPANTPLVSKLLSMFLSSASVLALLLRLSMTLGRANSHNSDSCESCICSKRPSTCLDGLTVFRTPERDPPSGFPVDS